VRSCGVNDFLLRRHCHGAAPFRTTSQVDGIIESCATHPITSEARIRIYWTMVSDDGDGNGTG
jgi:hypothetical protein